MTTAIVLAVLAPCMVIVALLIGSRLNQCDDDHLLQYTRKLERLLEEALCREDALLRQLSRAADHPAK